MAKFCNSLEGPVPGAFGPKNEFFFSPPLLLNFVGARWRGCDPDKDRELRTEGIAWPKIRRSLRGLKAQPPYLE